MTTTSAGPGRALLFIPGTLFWVLVIAGAITKNNILIGVGVAMMIITVGLTIANRVRASVAQSDARKQLWATGTPARARVVALEATGSAINTSPQVDLELEVTLPDQAPRRVTFRVYVSPLAIPRVQPDCMLDVRVDPNDPSRIAIDPNIAS